MVARALRSVGGIAAAGGLVLALMGTCVGAAASASVVRQRPPSAGAGPRLPGTRCPAFPADNVWNTPITGLPVDPHSAAWRRSMAAGSTPPAIVTR